MYNPISGTGDGSAPVVNITFEYLSKDHVKASVDGAAVSFTWTGASQITFSAPVTAGSAWKVYRETPLDLPLVDFTNGSVLNEEDLDTAFNQLRFSLQEGLGTANELRVDLATSAGAGLVHFDSGGSYDVGTVGATLKDLYGAFMGSPNFDGEADDATFTLTDGSLATPSTDDGAVLLVQKISSALTFEAFAATAFKTSSLANARATAFFSEASDKVGGDSSFVEGARNHGVLLAGADGAAYGTISVAGTASTGLTSPKYLIGSEAEVDDQIGPHAPSFDAFNKDHLRAAYVATNGLGGGTRYKGDAAFLTNPYSSAPWRTGLLFAENSIDHTGIGFRAGLSIVNGIDMTLANISGKAFASPNFSISGIGEVSMGNHTASADAPITGYITIKDAAGNPRKLAVIA